MAKDVLKTTGVIIDGVYYRVEEYPLDPWTSLTENGPFVLKKGVAYRYETELTHGLFPYRGIVTESFRYSTAKVGIWFKKINHSTYKMLLVRPRTMKEAEEYRIGREKDIVAAIMNYDYVPDQFMENTLGASESGSNVFLPPIHTDDDSLNMLMKLAMRKKNAPFEPYGKRLQALAVDKKAGVERSNAKNNARRGLKLNRAMSAGKFMEYADAWQLEPAFIIRDIPNAMHKMAIPEGKMLVIYPNGIQFNINQENLIDVRDMITQAIASPENEDGEDGNENNEEDTDSGD